MIKAEISRESKICKVKCQGSLKELLTDIMNIVCAVGRELYNKDHICGVLFEAALKSEISDGILDDKCVGEGFSACGIGNSTDEALSDLMDDITRQKKD